MGFFISKVKLKATAYSVHQFCTPVKLIFPVELNDEMIEAATVFLYLQMAKDIFGLRFTRRMAELLVTRLRGDPEQVIARISRLTERMDEVQGQEEYHAFVTRVIHYLLAEAGCDTNDAEAMRTSFERFQRAVGPIRKHLEGVKRQNVWVMRRAA